MAPEMYAWTSALAARDDEKKQKSSPKPRGPGGALAILLLGLFVLICAIAFWVVTTRLRARRLGLPPPAWTSYIPFYKSSSSTRNYPAGASGGVMGWIKDKVGNIRNRRDRTAGGAFEEPLQGGRGHRAMRGGTGPLDNDEAWDARVGTEADNYGPGGYNEEHELGLHDGGPGPYGGGGYTAHAAPPTYGEDDLARGRSRSRDPVVLGGSSAAAERKPSTNPFDDHAEESHLRGVSPRPLEMDDDHHDHDDHSERRSIFREGTS